MAGRFGIKRACLKGGLLALLALSGPATAQGVPAYVEPPRAAPPIRDLGDAPIMADSNAMKEARAQMTASVKDSFAKAYRAKGKPKLALYWNSKLSSALNEWYTPARVVETHSMSGNVQGDFNLSGGGQVQRMTEVQIRKPGADRMETTESFEWEFQDHFIGAFLDAGAVVLDRDAMIRLSGINAGSDLQMESKALMGKADYIMEILVAPTNRSSVGYELRTRIISVKTGAIVAMVNSKGMRDWQPEGQVLATDRGFEILDEDEEDYFFGPQPSEGFKATASGFEERRRPPKLSRIADSLAVNTMQALTRNWSH